MREGAELLMRSKKFNLDYIVRKLWECRFKNGDDCSKCPDLKICVDTYDKKC